MRNLKRVWALVLAIWLFCAVPQVCATAEEAAEERTQYRAAVVQLDAATYQVYCDVTYTNTTGQRISGVLFTMYANQLRRESSLVAEADVLEQTFPDGYAPGGVEVGGITVDGEPADWGMQGENELFVRVGCDLQPGESATFSFAYQLLLVSSRGEIGFSEDDVRLSGFLPGVAVWDDDEFVVNNTSSIDRYAYHAPADYVIDLTLQQDYQIAAAGTITKGESAEGCTAWQVAAQGVRDMALTLSKEYQTRTVTSEMGTVIRVMGWSKAGVKRAAETADVAIGLLEHWFGKAPYAEMTIAQADLVSDGDCFGGLMWIPEALYEGKNKGALEREVVFRLAQQYFGMGAGNDPAQAPWISTSVPEMVWYMYIDAREGRENMLGQINEDCLAALTVTVPGGYTVDSSLTAFSDRADYETIVLHRGAAAMYQIREAMGEENFLAGLRLFYEQYNGKSAGLKEFVGAFNEACGREYDMLIVDWMYTIDDYQGVIMDWFE